MEFISQTINLFHKGGPVMYLLVACSLFVVAIAVERFLYYRTITASAESFRQKLQPLLEKQRFSEAAQLCEQTQHALAIVAHAGLVALQRGSQVENALESAATLTSARLREHLDDLSMVVTLSPLLGLLGTVIGMINSFSVFNVQSGQPMAITGGVGEALVATATGLSVATLALVIHAACSRHVNRVVTDIEQTAALVVSYVLIKKTGRRDSHEIA
ncbi:MotA/TolQ/ExbB proton channel family protein [Sporomusa sp. KB1]|jgi:biopolymer transport protein ExbB|uniref:MotA/TolQ/ExbB proton channel family protein n=1 Tax=Sporomusa sp. KB1 TaxID=943346 RepID=UPI00119D7FA1|nr:MotA/TolQ/ExbB proton channel family protein [Sporomusa sp. KB1]TWH47346.1 biopolymer transport protein ExbB [Sporomusa sp. KB1]